MSMTTLLVLCAIVIVVLIGYNWCARFVMRVRFAILECYCLLSYEWQFAEEVIERIQNSKNICVGKVTKSKLIRAILKFRTGSTFSDDEIERLIIKEVLLETIHNEGFSQVRIAKFTRKQLQSWWHHVEHLDVHHQDRFVKFLTVEIQLQPQDVYDDELTCSYEEYKKLMQLLYDSETIDVELIKRRPGGQPKPPAEKALTKYFEPSYGY